MALLAGDTSPVCDSGLDCSAPKLAEPRWSKLVLLIALVALHACIVINQEDRVFGAYELISKEGAIFLTLKPDHSYSEVIRLPDSSEHRNLARWQWRDNKVCFEQLRLPKRVMGDYDDLKPEMRPKTVEGLSEFDDCVEAHWEHGKTVLEINPDTADNFVKVK